ncbi:MAG: PIN domain-containing protein [Azoarcus sp.]|jgi:predicted nucleic acid-binding protein|nr:PIN domain-containing protein [Azoarcus sp.]
MAKRTYLDSGVLLAAFKGGEGVFQCAMQILDDPDRILLVSDAVWLEIMPKPLYEKQHEETEFYETVFEKAERLSWEISTLDRAAEVAKEYGIAAMDAIHIAYALDAYAAELVTTEKPGKPMFRIKDVKVCSIRDKLT